MDNQAIRQQMNEWRSTLSPLELARRSNAVIDTVTGQISLEAYEAFLCFYPFRQEVDLRPLYESLLATSKRLFFPVTGKEEITFYEVSDLSEFHPGKFGILEPISEVVFEDVGDVLSFTPGLAFSESGERIGYGGGFYDRFYAAHPHITKVGVCFDEQLTREISVRDWDISMDFVATESGFYTNL